MYRLIHEEDSRKSIFPDISNKAAPRPSKRMATNDFDRAYPGLAGDPPIHPDISGETRYARMVQKQLLFDYQSRGAYFWPVNRVFEAISESPEEVEPGLFLIRLFSDMFIRPLRVGSGNTGDSEWVQSVDLVSRTVLQPAARHQTVTLKVPHLADSHFPQYFTWQVFWHAVAPMRVSLTPPKNPTSDAFVTLPKECIMRPDDNFPLMIPFLMRRGSEEDTVIIKHDTPIAMLRIEGYL